MKNEGGYLIEKEKIPELLKQAFVISNKLTTIFAIRLLCETKRNINETKCNS